MELELKKAHFDAYEAGGELVLTQEETTETIVPDYCPDIARIITTNGKIYLHRRELRDGKAEISGTVRVTVLYTPDDESGIRTLEFAMPFTAESDNRALLNCVCLSADTKAELLETRMLNPRKVFTHCKLTTRITGYQRAPLDFCTDADCPASVEKRREQQRAILLTHIAERDFTFTETINVSPGREGAAELLDCQVHHTVTESKIVGSKLIFKGLFFFSLLYRSVGGQLCSIDSELPFSQIMEVEGSPEGADVSLQLQLTGTDVQLGDDPEGREISVALYFHATALLRQQQELILLDDLYSTAFEMRCEAAPMELVSFHETLTRRQTVREVLEIGVVAESILSFHVCCSAVSVSREGETVVLRTGATVRALYLDEGAVPLVAERCIEVACHMDLPADCKVNACAVCAEEIQGSLGDRGIEVRFPVDFRVEAVCRTRKVCIHSAYLDTETPKDFSKAPSLVLRCLGKKESTWDLAKRYNTTIQTILAANQIEDEHDISSDKLLLIPRKRA